MFTCVTGVSGSGKSTLVDDTLYALAAHLHGARHAGAHDASKAWSTSTRSSTSTSRRSAARRAPTRRPTPALFTPIRELFAELPEARRAATGRGRFSFNVKGGRCEACQGDGSSRSRCTSCRTSTSPCDVCKGKRYNRETLEVITRARPSPTCSR